MKKHVLDGSLTVEQSKATTSLPFIIIVSFPKACDMILWAFYPYYETATKIPAGGRG